MTWEQEVREAAYYRWEKMGRPWLDESAQRRLWIGAEEELLRSRNKSYRLLLRDKDNKDQNGNTQTLEIRKYYPRKRVIVASHREYYLQFPYLVFAGRVHAEGSYLYVAFAKEEDDTLYFPSIPNMNPQTWGICLGRSGGHFQQDSSRNLDALIELFWITEFDPWELGWTIAHRALQQNFQGRYNYWKRLSTPEVLEHVSYMPISFENFVEKISKHYGDYEMRRLISDHTGCPQALITKGVDVEDDNKAAVFNRYVAPVAAPKMVIPDHIKIKIKEAVDYPF